MIKTVTMSIQRAVFFALMLLAGFCYAIAARANSLDALQQFINGTQSAKGSFEQKITDRNGKLIQQSQGTLAFSRPGKFRWTYVKPYAQLIVGDGVRVWVYDEDLNQVTVRKMDQALGSTPAALLAGSNDAMKAFDLKDEGVRDGLEWVLATPKQKEGSFETIRMGFGAAGLERMELHDSFGQITILRFTDLQRNARPDASQFQFTPPQGADVIGEK
ncbi:MAG TPA: outer membrane lipoprotein chaperone LolA [Burkholderiales bacterium]|nr:outer membrane lipoprotein chaperone LolA [Burkholderiales bacterium]